MSIRIFEHGAPTFEIREFSPEAERAARELRDEHMAAERAINGSSFTPSMVARRKSNALRPPICPECCERHNPASPCP